MTAEPPPDGCGGAKPVRVRYREAMRESGAGGAAGHRPPSPLPCWALGRRGTVPGPVARPRAPGQNRTCCGGGGLPRGPAPRRPCPHQLSQHWGSLDSGVLRQPAHTHSSTCAKHTPAQGLGRCGPLHPKISAGLSPSPSLGDPVACSARPPRAPVAGVACPPRHAVSGQPRAWGPRLPEGEDGKSPVSLGSRW